MTERAKINSLYNAMVGSGNVTYASGLVATPASGAPGAYAKLLADATPTAPWWLLGLDFGNVSAAGATVFNFQITRGEAGAGVTILNTINILLEAALATVQQYKSIPFPVRVAALTGCAGRQATASGKTLDIDIFYAQGVGS